VNSYYSKGSELLIKKANNEVNPTIDYNKIKSRIIAIQLFRGIRLVLIIFTISYFVGTLWYYFTKNTSEYTLIRDMDGEISQTTFYDAYSKDLSKFNGVIMSIYFVFSTLSTIGYGDRVPESDWERFLDCMIMLVGVAVFSYIMDSFIKIIFTFRRVSKENGDPEGLVQWFGVLKKFNKGRLIDS
jgi:hypothetical protein